MKCSCGTEMKRATTNLFSHGTVFYVPSMRCEKHPELESVDMALADRIRQIDYGTSPVMYDTTESSY